ncbi:cytochrome b-c1 complex subunit 2, mitochondrial-like isoform X2 [Haliotis rufescens]|uniref:cytochrome b-c1 complex subunit 2, mitochondrial-like isoform X2 n=1 Tax=Haliotis rufescens TaxID=6454 RepID=UPI00201F8185|nr:cytochrome b-c1 complex subunit 2, mitochondrial-like isoform X2 [Haliotis rufescens]
MATRASRRFMGTLKGRLMSSQAATAQSEAGVNLTKQAPKLTKLPNGMIVASLENYSPLSSVAVVVNAGSRFESGDNLGVTHCLRAAAGLSTQKASQFKITRGIQQIGGNLMCSTSREYMSYSSDCTRDNVDEVVELLREVTTGPSYKPWELSDLQSKLDLDLAILETQPQVRLFELLHQAAFRNTLGRSVYAPQFMVGKYSPEQLLHYVKNYFTGERMALVGAGVDHDVLVNLAKKFTPFSSAGAASELAQYHGGGEIRVANDGPLTYAAVAVEGPSLAAKELLPVGVLQNIMGTGPFIKYSPNTTVSKLGQAVSGACSQPFAVTCLNANYTDGGLFGFSAVAQPDEIGQVLRAAFNQFASVTKGVTDQEVARAKNQLKATVLMANESQAGVMADLGEQALGHQQIIPVEEVTRMIDAITTADVVNVAKRMINGKPSMAAVGNLSGTPYLDELYK